MATKQPLVLVTGPSGFIGAHVFTQLMHMGYTVRGTVRSQAKADYFKEKFPIAVTSHQMSFVIVKDIAEPEAFKDAVKGVDYIIHVASPFHFNVTDHQKDFYEPAIQGTTGILKEAAKEKSVKRVVITSSFAAVVNPAKGAWPGHVYREKDWNPITWHEATHTTEHITGYRASKTFAEKAAWDFIKHHKPHFDIITIQPPMVFGPCEHNITLDSLNESNAQIWRIISSGKDGKVPPTGVFRWVDVRDVAAAHVAAIEDGVKGNQRFLVSGGEFSWQKIADIAREEFPNRDIPVGDPNYKLPKERYTFDVSNAETQLGIKWTSLEKRPREIVHAHAMCVIHKAKTEDDASFAGIFTYFVQKLK